MVAVSAMTRAIARALRCRWRAASLAALAVLALDIALPPLVLSVVRGPWTYFTFNPWLARAPEYLVSDRPWTEKLDFLSRVALVWVSADGPYGQPEWGFAVDGADLARFVVTAALVATFVALWLERGAAGAPVPAARGGTTVGAIASVLGLYGPVQRGRLRRAGAAGGRSRVRGTLEHDAGAAVAGVARVRHRRDGDLAGGGGVAGTAGGQTPGRISRAFCRRAYGR